MFQRRFAPILALILVPAAMHAQAPVSNLNLFRNYFVTGDYAVGGVGLRAKGAGGLAKANIDIAGIPAQARIIAAWLYWQTSGDGAKGRFRGTGIEGERIGTSRAPCLNVPDVNVYRADVLKLLEQTKPGQFAGNGSHEVEIPDSGKLETAPSTWGASLIIVWADTTEPYRSVVLFDGAFTLRPGSLTFSTILRGFDDIPLFSNVKMTHIVAGGRADRKSGLFFDGRAVGATPDKVFTGKTGREFDAITFKNAELRVANDAASTVRTHSTGAAFPGTLVNCLAWGAVVMSTPVRDTDKDGLLDVWEKTEYKDAIDGTAVNLKAMGADPAVRDIFIEVDWMDKGAGETKDHRPKQAALDHIVAAFAAKNIKLRFDIGQGGQFTGGGTVVAHQEKIEFKAGFLPIKDASFAFNRRFLFKYALMAHKLGFRLPPPLVPPGGDPVAILPATGIADLPGGDFMLMMGMIPHTGANAADTMVGTVEEQASTIMHEAGHTLNLKHGGNESTPNYKPQHQSVMNYLHSGRGLFDDKGKFYVDYSDRALAEFDENALLERTGIGNGRYTTAYFAPPSFLDRFMEQLFPGSRIYAGRCPGQEYVHRTSAKVGAEVDWNNDFAIAAGAISSDIGGAFAPEPCALEKYKGHDDWAAINLQQTGARTTYSMGIGSPANPRSQDTDAETYMKALGPPAVTGLLAAVTQASVFLQWNSVESSIVTHYRIYRIGEPFGSISTVAYLGMVSQPLASFADSTAVSGNRYRYVVTAVDEFGKESGASDFVEVTR